MWTVLLACRGQPAPIPSLQVWFGQQEGDVAGQAVDVGVLAGDRSSILVGTPSNVPTGNTRAARPAGRGGVYLVDADTPGGVLDDVAEAVFTGSVASNFGIDVAITGDLTGDGLADVALSGVDEEGPISSVHVYAGPVSGTVGVGDAWMELEYDGSTENPYELAPCGDTDGDALDDLCILSRGGVSGGTAGVAVFFGPIREGAVTLAEASASIVASAGECVGESVDGGSDLDGDGKHDVVVSAGCDDVGLYLLSPIGPGPALLQDFPFWDAEPGSGGSTLTLGGDLDGDGLPDVFAGAPWWDDAAGRGHLVTNKDGGSLGGAHATFEAGRRDWTGRDAAVADLDGDGLVDLAIGAPTFQHDLKRPGQVAVFLGPISAGAHGFQEADLAFTGSRQPDAFGVTLAAGDVDGDGRADLAVGAPGDSSQAATSGAVYLFSGTSLFP